MLRWHLWQVAHNQWLGCLTASVKYCQMYMYVGSKCCLWESCSGYTTGLRSIVEIWVGLPILEVSQTHEDANPQVYLPFDTDMASHFLICTCSYCCSIPIALHDHLLHQGISKQIDKDILSLPNDTIYLAAAKSWIVTVRLTSGSWYPNITRCVPNVAHQEAWGHQNHHHTAVHLQEIQHFIFVILIVYIVVTASICYYNLSSVCLDENKSIPMLCTHTSRFEYLLPYGSQLWWQCVVKFWTLSPSCVSLRNCNAIQSVEMLCKVFL